MVWPNTQTLGRAAPTQLAWMSTLLKFAFIGSVVLYFLLPGNLLVLSGWDYLGGGAEYQKIHPATYLLITIFFVLITVDVPFRNMAARIAFKEFTFSAFAVSAVAMAFFTAVTQQVSIAPFVDTLGSALLVTLGCLSLSLGYLKVLIRFLNIYFVVNIGVIFLEYFTKSSIIDPGAYSQYQEAFRTSAFFEAPLSAAQLLGVYSLLLLQSTRILLSLNSALKLLLSFAAFCAIATTGGRTALVTTGLLAVAYLTGLFIKQVRLGYFTRAGTIYSLTVVPALIIIISVVFWLGLFDTIVGRFENDIGSALSRQMALDLLYNMSPSEMFFGLSTPDLLNVVWTQQKLNLVAIEISWVNFILAGGLLFTIPLFTSYVLFLFHFLRRYCGRYVFFPSFLILVTTSSSNGIWTKTTVLTSSIALMISYLRSPH